MGTMHLGVRWLVIFIHVVLVPERYGEFQRHMGVLTGATYYTAKCPVWEQLSTTESGWMSLRDTQVALCWANRQVIKSAG